MGPDADELWLIFVGRAFAIYPTHKITMHLLYIT